MHALFVRIAQIGIDQGRIESRTFRLIDRAHGVLPAGKLVKNYQ